MEMNAREERKPHKKIGVVFNAFSSEHKKKNVATSTVSNDEQDDKLSPSKKHEKNVPQE